MIGAAKRKSSLLPGLAALRLVLLLIVTLCLGETRVWGFAITPQPTSGVFESVTPSCIGQNTTAIGYDPSDSLLAARGADNLVTVRTYTGAAGREGITSSGALRADTWVTLPGEIPLRAGHLQIEKLLEIQPGRGANFLEFQVPSSNLRIPANGPTTSGGALQFQLNNPVPIDPSTFRLPPGRPAR